MNTDFFSSHLLLLHGGIILDSLVLLAIVSIIWFLIQRHVAVQWGIALYMLVVLKAVVFFAVPVPETVARFTPTQLLQRAIEQQETMPAPAQETAQPIAEETAVQVSVQAAPEVLPEVQTSSAVEQQTTPSAIEPRERSYLMPPPDQPERAMEIANVTPVAKPEPVSASPTPLKTIEAPAQEAVVLPISKETVFSYATTVFLLFWIGGVVALTVCAMLRLRKFRRLLRGAIPLCETELPLDYAEICRSLGLKPVPMFTFSGIASPAVYGLFRPIILLPKQLLQTVSVAELRWILLHELAHIKRRDMWYVLLTQIVSVLFFFNLAIWISRKMIHRLRECACDDFAMFYSQVSPIEASEAFMKILKCVSLQKKTKADVPTLAVLDPRSAMFQRMRRILDTDRTLRVRFGVRSMLVWLVLAALCLPYLVARENPDPQVPAVQTEEIDVFGALIGTIVDTKGKPVPGAVVELYYEVDKKPMMLQTASGVDGKYRLPLSLEQVLSISMPTLRAMKIDMNVKTGGMVCAFNRPQEKPMLDYLDMPIDIELQPVHKTENFVRDENGKPVSGATVEALVDFQMGFSAPFSGIDTDAKGQSFVEIPEGVRIRDVWVKKPGLGLDYIHNTTPPEEAGLDMREERYRIAERLPEKMEFTLRGAETFTVHVQDAEGSPVEGTSVGPWIIELSNQTDGLNLSCSRISETVSNADGNAVLDWIPANRSRGDVEFHCIKGSARPSDRPQLQRGVPRQTVILDVQNVILIGTVTDETGKPLPGTLVECNYQKRALTDESRDVIITCRATSRPTCMSTPV